MTHGRALPAVTSFIFFAACAAAQVAPSMLTGLRWRDLGPHHGGRIAAVSGAIGQPGVFYAGLPQGGIEKTTSAGVTWFLIFDGERKVDSVGAIQVAPSNPAIVYAGTGDSVGGSNGDGMYKSTDAGRSWTHIGLASTVKINAILISPTNPNVVLASTQGDARHNGRGVFRTSDGGKTWTHVLDPAGYNGTRVIAWALDAPSVVFAATQGTSTFRFGPPPPHAPQPKPAALYKSTDGGRTWQRIRSIPDFPGRIGIAVAMHTHAQRVYVIGNPVDNGSGLFRSDDGGKTWRHMDASETRISNGQGSYSSGVFVDPQNPDIVYTVATAIYRSTDGGNSFIPFKGAPGGEDAHCIWIDPTNGRRMIVGMDQGASVSLDGGNTWSTYYNQPVAQIYHIDTTNQYPFWVVASQQDTAGVMMPNRSHFGEVNVDWRSLPTAERGRLAADPLHPEIIYGVEASTPGAGDGVNKINTITGQWENVAPNFGVDAGRYRQSRDQAKHFDLAFNPQALYVAYQCLMVTTDGAQAWNVFSPDLTAPKGQPLAACGSAADHGRGAIADFSISTAKAGVFWTVSTNGQVYNTQDNGATWTNVSNIPDASGVTFINIQASHQDPETAYLSGRLGGGRFGAPAAPGIDTDVPLIWRTTDGGRTWTQIVTGLPRDQRTGSWVNVVRADPQQAGLLFCGTESAVYVSFDNGDHWQSLQRNMPTTSVRDLKFHTFDHEDDLLAATYGRGVWVLDDITPLEQITSRAAAIAAAPVYLFQPGDAIRSRENVQWDQPVQREENHAPNPPYGAIIYYHLSRKPAGPITLSIYDSSGVLVRRLSSVPPPPVTGADFPSYWLATPQSRALPTAVGTNRTHWNLRYASPLSFDHDLEDETIFVEGQVIASPQGPQVLPGTYSVKLRVDGQTYTRPLTVLNDPRIGQGPSVMAALRAQDRLNRLTLAAMAATYHAGAAAESISRQLASLTRDAAAPSEVRSQARQLTAQLKPFAGASGLRRFFFRSQPPAPGTLQSFRALNRSFGDLIYRVQVGYDMAPTKAMLATAAADCAAYHRTLTAWQLLSAQHLAPFNGLLTRDHLAPLPRSASSLALPACSNP